MRLAMVVAVSTNGIIGRDGDLPWRQSADLKWFKRTTMGKPIIMGRKTYESIGRPLPGRANIVLTRAKDFSAEGILVTTTPDEALVAAHEAVREADVEEVCVIGGAEIYRLFAPRMDRLYLTIVHAQVDGDVSFPAIDWSDWQGRVEMTVEPDDKNEYPATMLILDRVSPVS